MWWGNNGVFIFVKLIFSSLRDVIKAKKKKNPLAMNIETILMTSVIGVSAGILSSYTANAIAKNQFTFFNLSIISGLTLIYVFIIAFLAQYIYNFLTKRNKN